MKHKDLYNFVRTEIINELSETTQTTTVTSKSGVNKVLNVDTADTSTIDNIKKDPNIASATMGTTKLKEMARKPNKLTVGDGFADAKEVYTGGLISRVLDLVGNAGDEGITQKELADALNIKSMPQINPIIRELVTIGALSVPKGVVAEPEEDEITTVDKEEPQTKPEDVEDLKDEEDEEEVKDDYEKPDEEDKGAEEFEKEPSAADIKAAEKLAKDADAKKLSPEDEDKYAKIKSGIQKKLEKIKKLPKDKRTSSDDFKILKQLVSRDDVKKLFKAKGISILDFIKV